MIDVEVAGSSAADGSGQLDIDGFCRVRSVGIRWATSNNGFRRLVLNVRERFRSGHGPINVWR